MGTYVDSTGYTAPRAADFRAAIRSAVEAGWGVAVDWDRDTLISAMVDAVATELGTVSEATQAIYDAMQVGNATGQQLDNLCTIVGVSRKAATPSQAILTLTGTAGAVIPSGLIVQGGGTDGRARWRLSATVTLDGAGAGEGVIVAEEAGAVQADADAIRLIATPTAGLSNVTNPDPATIGTDVESDADLRRRRQASLQQQGAHSLTAIRAELLALDGIAAAAVIDNPTPDTTTVQGVSLAGYSVAAIVLPSTLTDVQRSALAASLYAQIPAGIYASGDESAQVYGADGYARTIRWYYGTDVSVDVSATLTLATGYELADVSGQAEAAIAAYFGGLTLGDAARTLAILTAIAAIEGVIGCALTLDGNPADVTALLSERLVTGAVVVS